jgi:hypothetical protein
MPYVANAIRALSVASLVATMIASAQTTEPMLTYNPMADLPSPPGPTVGTIKELAPDSWVELGPPADDPLCGSARGRSWGTHAFTPAPKWRGAMFNGEGRHAYVKPDGYGMDDMWFYDIHAHAWICLYRGTNTVELLDQVKMGLIVVDDLGQAVDTSGQPIPAHINGHAYHWTAYVPSNDSFFILSQRAPWARYYFPGLTSNGENRAEVDEALAALERQGLNAQGTSFGPWKYDLRTGRFSRGPVGLDSPFSTSNYPYFDYVSSRHQFIRIDREQWRYLDILTNAWGARQASNANGIEFSGSYDAVRDQILFGSNDRVMRHFDVATGAMTVVEGKPDDFSLSVNNAGIYYDSVSHQFLIFAFKDFGKIYPLDADSLTFLPSTAIHPGILTRSKYSQYHAFFDPGLGVMFIYVADDSGDNGTMWAYRPSDEQVTRPQPTASQNVD